jgi:hypothetical protein
MEQKDTGFKDLLNSLMQKRWYVTAIVLGLFIIITLGIFSAIVMKVPMAAEWKEILLLLLGAFIGSYGKIVDYYYSDSDKDKLLVAKMDEENDTPDMLMAKMDKGISSGQLKESNKPVTPIIPDAFIQGAAAARELAKDENKQNFELAKAEMQHDHEMDKLEASKPKPVEQPKPKPRTGVEVDEDGDGTMDGIDFDGDGKIDMYFAHRQCEHVWGDSDNDGDLECLKCGKIKD